LRHSRCLILAEPDRRILISVKPGGNRRADSDTARTGSRRSRPAANQVHCCNSACRFDSSRGGIPPACRHS
jgi:hypothetical protein